MPHKSHLALILPIAIREPRETKKTNLCRIPLACLPRARLFSLSPAKQAIAGFPWNINPQPPAGLLTDLQKPSLFYYIYHYAVSNVIMQTVNNVGCKA